MERRMAILRGGLLRIYWIKQLKTQWKGKISFAYCYLDQP